MIIAITHLPFDFSAVLPPEIDALEIILDRVDEETPIQIQKIKKRFTGDIIFSIEFAESDSNFPSYLEIIAELKPTYLILKFETSKNILESLKQNYPDILLIGKYHHILQSPHSLIHLLEYENSPLFQRYKVVTQVNNVHDVLKLFSFIRSQPIAKNIDFTCHGFDEKLFSILSALTPLTWHYVDIHQLDELLNYYHYRDLNPDTKIYALLGDPVDLSVGHILHNQAMQYLQKNAVYIKLLTPKLDLTDTLNYCRDLPFYGLSITMPLKEEVFSQANTVDNEAKSIQAINSIVKVNDQFHGFNTDGVGAMQGLLNKKLGPGDLRNQKIVILGAGGAARAIAYAAFHAGAKVIVVNRSFQKAEQLAQEIQGEAHRLDQHLILKNLEYDFLINTLPEKTFSDDTIQNILQAKNLCSNATVMDIVYQPVETVFLKIARSAGCHCIPGYQMYIQQALLQIQRWFEPNEDQLLTIKAKMEDFFQTKG